MTDGSVEFQALWDEQEVLNFTDDRALIDWLYRVFDVARTYGVDIPFRMEVAPKIWPQAALHRDMTNLRAAETQLVLRESCDILTSEHPTQEFHHNLADRLAFWLRG